MVFKTFLIFLITLLGYSEWFLGTSYVERPIVLGPLVGLVLGNLQAGVIMGATLELAMIGMISIGAYIPPDVVSGTIIGVSLAIESNAKPAAALTLGIPVATIILAADTAIGNPLQLLLIHRIDKNAADANSKAITLNMLLAGYVGHLPGLIFCPLGFYFGSTWVTKLLGFIPNFVQTGMNIAAGLLPALGFAMLAQMIWKKNVAAFFFLGFFMVAYGHLTTTGVAIFATILALVLYFFIDRNKKNQNTSVETNKSTPEGDGFDEF